MKKGFSKIGTIIFSVVLSVAAGFVFYGLASAAFIGPANPPPGGNGAVSVDANNNVSITGQVATPPAGVRVYIKGQDTGTNFGLQVYNTALTPGLVVRNDTRVGINTASPNFTLDVNGQINGNFVGLFSSTSTVPAANVTPGTFSSCAACSSGPYGFPGKLGINISTSTVFPQELSVYGNEYVSQYVAISTSSMTYPLNVGGNLNVGSGGVYRKDGVAGINATNCTPATTTVSGGIITSMTCAAGGATLVNAADVASGTFGNNRGLGNFSFVSNLGLNTVSPQTFLHVKGPAGGGTAVLIENQTDNPGDNGSKSPRLGLVDTQPAGLSGSPAWIFDNVRGMFRIYRQNAWNGIGTGTSTFIGVGRDFKIGIGGQIDAQEASEVTNAAIVITPSPGGGNTQSKVGIGTSGPGYRLDVQGGDVNVSGVYRKAGVAGIDAACPAGSSLISTTTSTVTVSGGIITAGTCVTLGSGTTVQARNIVPSSQSGGDVASSFGGGDFNFMGNSGNPVYVKIRPSFFPGYGPTISIENSLGGSTSSLKISQYSGLDYSNEFGIGNGTGFIDVRNNGGPGTLKITRNSMPTAIFDSSGRMGIGNLSPSEMLEVTGSIYTNGEGAGFIWDAGNNKRAGLIKQSGLNPEIRYSSAIPLMVRRVTAGTIVAPTGSDTPLIFDTTGNIGIGTAIPQSALHIATGYIQIPTVTSAPPSADCDAASEEGRIILQVANITGPSSLYICTAVGGAISWRTVSL